MLEYPRWKYLLVVVVLALGLLFALPNVFGEQDALQVERKDGTAMDAAAQKSVTDLLATRQVATNGSYVESGRLMVRFDQRTEQIKARDAANETLSEAYRSALSTVSRAPRWLQAIGAKPMPLGLDLRGGLYLLYEVDLSDTINQLLASYEQAFRRTLVENKIAFGDTTVLPGVNGQPPNTVRIAIPAGASAETPRAALAKANIDLAFTVGAGSEGGTVVDMVLTPTQISDRQTYAIQQNRVTLENRINELGVSESVVQQQGKTRLNVQLPGKSNAAEVKDIVGKVATLEFRLEDWQGNAYEAQQRGRAPLGSRLYKSETGQPVLLKRDLIATGDQLTTATSAVGNQGPEVNIQLNGTAAESMLRATRVSVGKRMAIVYIEKSRKEETVNGQKVERPITTEKIISLATIQSVLSNSFRITGLTAAESRELALLLRSGSLVAPIYIVQESVVGASLGQDNIDKGVRALIIGMGLVFAFMAIYYRKFGWIANLVLLSNIVLLAALMSMIRSALSLPGIAGMVLTVGMAVDANILIYERIREELRNGVSPQAAIRAGFDKAWSAILDSNITTLIAGLVLWIFGTGAIRGFAVVLTFGIMTSMFTAIVGSRALVTLLYGGSRRVEKLSI
jgi:preprotein translocase subunit SecD